MSRRQDNQRSALIEAFLDSYVAWREACEDVRTAYWRWAECNPQQLALGFATYRAALDREEYAADVHSQWADRLGAFARSRKPASSRSAYSR